MYTLSPFIYYIVSLSENNQLVCCAIHSYLSSSAAEEDIGWPEGDSHLQLLTEDAFVVVVVSSLS